MEPPDDKVPAGYLMLGVAAIIVTLIAVRGTPAWKKEMKWWQDFFDEGT